VINGEEKECGVASLRLNGERKEDMRERMEVGRVDKALETEVFRG
jgi:hypothetical protein